MDNQWYYLLATVGMGLGGLWTLFIWLTKQFKDSVQTIMEKMEKLQEAIMRKMEYHERHDDGRFDQVNNELWAIKIRNAAIDGRTTAEARIVKAPDNGMVQ